MAPEPDSPKEALRRWEAWLAENFPADHLARERGPTEARSGDVVWHVEFQDGKLGRIQVTRGALTLTGEDFARLTRQLDRIDWYAALDESIWIRIDRNGVVEEVPLEDR